MTNKSTENNGTKSSGSQNKSNEVSDGVKVKAKKSDPQKHKYEMRAKFSSGPIPDPETLARYEEVLPGSADRIVTMAENQATHRQEMERKVTQANVKDGHLGMWFAFILGVLTIGGGVILSLFGQQYGSLLSLVGLGSLVGTFIYGSRSTNSK